MDFKAATDAFAGCFSLDEIGEALGVSGNTVRRARMDPKSSHSRSAPPGWEAALAKLAKAKGKELARLAEQLELRAG